MNIDETMQNFFNGLISNEDVYVVVLLDSEGGILQSRSKLQGDNIIEKLSLMAKNLVNAIYNSLNKFEEIEGNLRFLTINMESGFSLLYILGQPYNLLIIARTEKINTSAELKELINKVKEIISGNLEEET